MNKKKIYKILSSIVLTGFLFNTIKIPITNVYAIENKAENSHFEYFDTFISGNGEDSISAVLNADDYGLIYSIKSNSTDLEYLTKDSSYYLIYSDLEGNIKYSIPMSYNITSFIQLSYSYRIDNITSCYLSVGKNDDNEIYLTIFNEDGTIKNEIKLDSKYKAAGNLSIVEDSNNDCFYLTGVKTDTSELSILKLDYSFNVLKSVDIGLASDDFLNIDAEDGIVIASGKINGVNTILKFDGDLNILWQQEVSETYDKIKISDNDYFFFNNAGGLKYTYNSETGEMTEVFNKKFDVPVLGLCIYYGDLIETFVQGPSENSVNTNAMIKVYDMNLNLINQIDYNVEMFNENYSDFTLIDISWGYDSYGDYSTVIVGNVKSQDKLGDIYIGSLRETVFDEKDILLTANVVPAMTVSVDTNVLNFDNISPLTTEIKTLNVSVQSNVPYNMSINAKDDFKDNSQDIVLPSNYLKFRVDGGSFMDMPKGAENANFFKTNEPLTEMKNYQMDFKIPVGWTTQVGKYEGELELKVLPVESIPEIPEAPQ